MKLNVVSRVRDLIVTNVQLIPIKKNIDVRLQRKQCNVSEL